MPVHTTNQKMAREAYSRITRRKPGAEYASFAREFPILVHSCGLAQAVAFALAKGEHWQEYVDDLAAVLRRAGWEQLSDARRLSQESCNQPVTQYLRLSRNVLAAAVWLKHYVEAGAAAAGGGSSPS
jgi:CRISPR-associated protein Cmr5